MTVKQLSFDALLTPRLQTPPRRAVLHSVRARIARDHAISRADKHADEAWKEAALNAVIACAIEHAHFTTDAVIELLAGMDVHTHEPRALGPIMRSAARSGYITATDRFENSASVSRHRAPKRIWKSNLYKSA